MDAASDMSCVLPQSPQVPSAVWRMLSAPTHSEKLTRGLDAIWDMGLGLVQRLSMRQKFFLHRAATICAMDEQFSKLTDDGLHEIVGVVSRAFRLGRARTVDENRAYALIREVAYRQLGMKPHLVQVAAALAMDAGCIAELATGEGKTLVATMPATIAGWRARGCHVITVNDYLAHRDAQLMKPIYDFCGLSVGWICEESDHADRRRAYAADITYCTNKTVAADFLRDRLALGQFRDLPSAMVRKITDDIDGPGKLVMRGLEVALIDEADSVLIDEAATPLIIADESHSAEHAEQYMRAAALAKQMVINRDYVVDVRYREVVLTDIGREHLRELTDCWEGIWQSSRRSQELLRQAISARELFIRDQQYFVEDNKVIIIDESTGRAMPDRSWRAGMHQAVEAKENLPVTPDRETMARVSFQRFFRLYRKLCGMTGTAHEARAELWHIYHLPTVRIPTHRPVKRIMHKDEIFANCEAKWKAVVKAVQRIHDTGRPVLIGTRSVEISEHLSTMLTQAGLEHRIINAVRHAEEAQVIAQAGEVGRITVATNMAGRGTDIKLGEGVEDLGGLAVIATERHETPRVDRQLFGRAGRQGNPGSAHVFIALEDELIERYTPLFMKPMLAKLSGNNPDRLTSRWARHLVRHAQRKAQRIALAQRKSVVRKDDWLDESLGFAGREL